MVNSLSKASKPESFPVNNAPNKESFPDKHAPGWWRGLVGLAYVSVGVLAASAGLASISYRLTHMTVRDGLVNGRTVRIQAPVDGEIQDFYARPGARVQSGQVLARLTPTVQQGQNDNPPVVSTAETVPDAQFSNQSIEIRLAAAQQTLELLTQQLDNVTQQEQALQNITLNVASETVDYSDAAVTAAASQERAAQKKYERFNVLLEQGAISQQEVDELEADWRSSQAAVQQAQSEQSIARVNAGAIAQQVPLESNLKNIQSQKQQLTEEIQRQTSQIELLALELQAGEALTVATNSTAQTVSATLSEPAFIPLLAPFEGVIYATHHDAGEQVNRPTDLLSLLDCHALWVEALVTVDQANRIDASQPVRIQHSGNSDTVVGYVDYVTAVSSGEITKARSEALIPAVSASLTGQPLARVRVSMPASQVQEQSYRFCGVGESAKLTFGTQATSMNFLSRLPRF
ncbi:MAG: HlyD family efflux transporter periplasmic adaptor subunit [Cyanobacteria bacterium P01_H01_bin.26]